MKNFARSYRGIAPRVWLFIAFAILALVACVFTPSFSLASTPPLRDDHPDLAHARHLDGDGPGRHRARRRN